MGVSKLIVRWRRSRLVASTRSVTVQRNCVHIGDAEVLRRL